MVDFKKKLNKEQLKVVYEGDGPCLVLSGPGSGKTRTLVYRTVYLLEKGFSPSSIMLLTFTKKAAKEMLFRIKTMACCDSEKIYGGTFHHVANIFLRRYGEEVGYSSNFVIVDEEDAKTIISGIIKEKYGKQKEDVPKPKVIKNIISLAVNSEKTVEEVIGEKFSFFSDEVIDVILEITEEYKKRKKESNVMDYDDLLFNWNSLLSIPELRKKISDNFLYVMVDEYQDTNKLQDRIIKKISEKNKNILAVGDDSQSIYSFRAAEIDNIINFSKNYPEAKIFKLENNYRSTAEILEMANLVIKNNTKRLDKDLKSVVPNKGEADVVVFSNPLEQADYIADYIENKKDRSEVAVLFRAHHHAVELEMELTKRNIPYLSRGGVRFFEQLHIKDVTAYLRVLLNFKDRVSFERLLLKEKGIGDVGAKKISGKISSFEKVEDVFENKEKIAKEVCTATSQKGFLKIINLIEEGTEKTISEKIKLFIDDFYNHYLDFSFENSKERKSDLKKIYEMSFDYEKLEDIISDFSLSEDVEEERSSNSVVLSTIHQAKGLEWKTVFIISLKEGDFPHAKAVEEGSVEEERRLFYVAVTRCKENLFLTYPRYNFREKQIMPPSRFIKETKGVFSDEDFFEDEEIIMEDGEDGEWEMM
ncbi:MAG: ATP-dependent helicase [Candidatus Pacebacteria bacterium]|nr:ATP-dependent helicase [Candidatus Paceibacterota bacterium]